MLPVKRKLDFGEEDGDAASSSNYDSFLQTEMQKAYNESCDFWNFDFGVEKPLPGGRWEWCRIEEGEAPEAYNTEYSAKRCLINRLEGMVLQADGIGTATAKPLSKQKKTIQQTITNLLPSTKQRSRIPTRIPGLRDLKKSEDSISDRSKMSSWMLPTSPTLPVRT